MNVSRDVAARTSAGSSGSSSTERGWYLYGIARQDALPGALEDDEVREQRPGFWADAEPLQSVEHAGLAAIVRPVSPEEFDEEALRGHAEDPAWLESIVRGHNAVVEAVHRRHAILPAKFGSVYASREDIMRALDDVHDVLLDRLQRLDDCDEWAVHVYADPENLRQRAAQGSPARQLQDEIVNARPGRAYFLQRKLADEIAAGMDQIVKELAAAAVGRLGSLAAGSQLTAPTPSPANAEREILRGAFLVSREKAERFLTQLRDLPETIEGVRIDYSGPWPPYSFATLSQELQ